MHAESIMRKFRILTFIIPALALASCETGSGPESIPGTPATPLPDVEIGFCDPINFELVCGVPPITNFASGVTEVKDNPDMSGINTSERVAQMQKFSNPVELFGGSRLDLATPITFDGADTFQAFTMKVWSSRPVAVLLKAEENTDGSGGIGRPKGHSGSGTWEELCYEFAGADLTNDVLGITVIFDNGVRGAAGLDPDNWTFFYDDITRVENCPPGPPTELPVDFENEPFDYNFGPDGGFEGAFTSVITNPDQSGINTSLQVARTLKFPVDNPVNTFGGSALSLDVTADIESGSSFTMKVWSQRPVPVLVEPSPQGPGSGSEVTHTGTGWELLTFPLPAATVGTVEAVVVIFDRTEMGDAENNPADWTFYYDDITLLPPGSGGGPGGGGPPGGGGGTAPTAAAPTPTEAAANVVSLFSNAYTNVTVGDFSTTWDTADVSDVVVDGDDVKQYVPTGGNATLGFIGINFDNANAIDGTGYDTLRMDIWTPDVTNLLVKLVDFGGDGFEGALADSTGTSTQTLTTGVWQTISIPFSEFQTNGLANLTELSQIVLEDLDGASGGTTLYVDNIYFFNSAGGGGTAPTAAAPTPTEAAGDVVSLFSNAYTDVTVGDFSTTWDTADVSDVVVDGDDVKLYGPTGGNATLGFIGINFDNANAIDGTGYDTLRMDIWTPDVTSLLVKLVDFGGDGFEGALADSTGTSTQLLTTGGWQTLSIPFSELQTNGLANLTELSQIVLEDLGGAMGGTTIYLDNLYFFNSAGGGGGGTAPTAAAPTPTAAAGDVASLFSNAYTDLPVGDFSTTWDTADVSDVVVDGNDVKQYVPTGGNATLGFIGINFDNANAIDGTGYDTLRMDIWTPDVTNLLVKLVDFGGDGFQGTLADSTGTSTQTLTTGTWQTLSIPFSEFQTNGLANLTELSQIVLEDLDGATGGTTLYVDNIYFFNSAGGGGGGGTAPTAAAPTPTAAAGDVASLFSNAYTDLPVGDFSTTWDTADVSDVQVAGDDVKLYVPTGGNATLGFVGINFDNANAIDGTGYDTLRMDIWTPDVTNLLVKLVDFGGDGFQGTLADTTGTSTQTLTTGVWQTISIPFSEFQTNGLANLTELSQIVLEDLDGATGGTTLYVDNIYFFNSAGGGGGGGGGTTFVNGDFESGDLTGWTAGTEGTITVESDTLDGRTGIFARLRTSAAPQDVLLSQVALGAGTISPGDTISVSYDLYGSLAGAGGVVFVEVIFLDAGGNDVGGRDFIGSGAPSFPTTTWTNYSGTVTAGTGAGSVPGFDVSGGVTLQLKAACGGDPACAVDAYFDNVTFSVN